MKALLLPVALILCGLFAAPAMPADLEHLRPSARWLATERLKATLFHHTNIKPSEPLLMAPVVPGTTGSSAALVLRGRHYLIVLPEPGRRVQLELQTVIARDPFRQTLYGVFDSQGQPVAEGLVGMETKTIDVPCHDTLPHILLLNSGPASSTVSRVALRGAHWAVDTRSKQAYRDGPMHYHFLRDLKLGGFNLAMVDVEYVPQEFLSDQGLARWTSMIAGWAEAARRYQMRTMFAIDLGGTAPEVESWGDAPKGLYVEDPADKEHRQASVPLAPCPLQKVYWERIVLRRGREVARLARQNPFIVGYAIDPEMYQCHVYGHYKPGGTCYCDHCLGGFLRGRHLPNDVLRQLATGEERLRWLRERKLTKDYDAYLEEETRKIAVWCREELHREHPDLLLCVYVLEIGNWFCRGLARGLSTPDLPVVNFCEHTYYSVGYDRPWLDKTLNRFQQIGSNFLQGSAIWDLHFPPTRPEYLAAHVYNLAVRAEGWWYWPGDRLYDDWNVTHTYRGEPAYFEDFWNAAATANHEVDLTMRQPGRTSPLDHFEPVPWRGKFRSQGWTEDSGVVAYSEPAARVRLAAPAKLAFALGKRAPRISITALARGAGNAASLELIDPAGRCVARAAGEFDRPETITADGREGVWRLTVTPQAGKPLTDVGLALSPPAMISAAPESLLATPGKEPGLVGWWPLDDGQGQTVADVSQKVSYPGVLRSGHWVAGVRGKALALREPNDGVLVAGCDGLHDMPQFTLSAWVRLDELPQRGNGGTLINKGPEAPVQHFWWWIGYPPSYALTLELGSPEHAYGKSASSKALEWKLGQWYHVAAVIRCDGKQTTISQYRDGQLLRTQTFSEAFHAGNHDLKLGTYGGTHTLHGALDEVKIWDRALTPNEIHQEATRKAK
jgi:hypothetical protein